jgi:signal transduction histidine kinase
LTPYILIPPLALIAAFLASTYYWHSMGARLGTTALLRTTSGAQSIAHLTAARGELRRIESAAAASLTELEEKEPTGRQSLTAASAALRADLEEYRAIPAYPGEQGFPQQLIDGWQLVDNAVASFADKLQRKDLAGARKVWAEALSPAGQRLDKRIQEVIAFNAEQQNWFAHSLEDQRLRASRLIYGFDAAAIGFALLVALLVVRSVRLQWRLTEERERSARQRAEDVARFSERLERLNDAAATLSESIGESTQLPQMARLIADRARQLTGADYAGVGFRRDSTTSFELFVSSGEAGVAGSPELLSGSPERSYDGPLLRLPILSDLDEGRLLLLRRPGREAFDNQDERIARLLATHAVVATNNLHLYQTVVKAVRARDDVLAVVSHDLKNPLSIIRMTAIQLAHHAPEQEASAQARKEGERISRATERMVRLIDDLLDLARVDSGTLRIRQQPESAEALVIDALDLMMPVAEQKSIRLSSEVAAVPLVFCEREMMARVFSNLIGNAIKFTPECGSITVSARVVDGEVRFAVTDTGRGIPAHLKAHVFERFWQEDPDRRGTGLGLYISRGIVEAHGGHIGVESQHGAGTTVWFTLPVQAPVEVHPVDALH